MHIYVKRLIDFFSSLIILFIFSPLYLAITITLFISLKNNPFFIQERPGKNEKIFKLIKFKTMNDKTDENGKLLPDKERLTKIGKIIRSLSLDELPQLINVLKGNMSLVGPRPLLIKYLPLYNERQRKRHNVKPGITGWAQVNGRNNISWEEKFELDVEYVENVCFLFDMKILWMTILKVIKREGINSISTATMYPFTGNS
ncbi:MAG: sugar transferase [Ignavibacteria bacterium]